MADGNPQHTREMLERLAPAEDRPYIADALDVYLAVNPVALLNPDRIFMVARKLRAQDARAPTANARTVREELPTSAGDARTLAVRLATDVRAVRRAVFGSPLAPFRRGSPARRLAAAARWIESQTDTLRPTAARDLKVIAEQIDRHEHRRAGRREAEAFRQALREVLVGGSARMDTITYIGPRRGRDSRLGGRVLAGANARAELRTVRAAPDSTLGRLAAVARRLATETGVPEHRVVAHILAGAPLVRRLAVLEWRSGVPPRLIVTLAERLTADDWRRIKRMARRGGRHTPVRLPTRRAQVVLDVVRAFGGVPAQGRKAFWERVSAECARTAPALFPRRRRWRAAKSLYRSWTVNREGA